MVSTVADLLRAYYFEAKYVKNYDAMLKCIDTLSEFVQGPCLENQVNVSDSRFFDVANDIFALKKKAGADGKSKSIAGTSKAGGSKVGKSNASGFGDVVRTDEPVKPWMIARLQSKCLVLVMSLLEMRDVKTDKAGIIKKIIRNLPLYVLERHLDKMFKKY